ncbi:hypothetical protein ACFQ1M_08740 [Sungkyunkwania multivorans]|uniref:Uncharacterized protein n=1 Tax=Sungkyunkwania multivorans TaxID=1173618 RepID=A0ABW3CWZ9_9FLAO
MKKISLLMTAMLLVVTAAQASEKISNTDLTLDGLTFRYYAQPIQFVERGVTFYVFPNGEFDFNTHATTYRRGRRGGINTTYGAPGVRRGFRSPRFGVRIEHDNFGRIRRIGNTFINYTRHGMVKRIGTVYVQYNRRGLVRQVGGMHIRYNRWGKIIGINGSVKFNAGCGFCGATSCNIDHFGNGHDHDFGDDHYDDDDYGDDDDLYYYKSKKQKAQELDID